MNKLDRKKVDKPDCLTKMSKKWTADFKQKREKQPNYWNWHQYKKEKVEHLLMKELSEMSDYHCSYCGIFPLKKDVGGRSIDHFKPKSKFPDLSFDWTNLFASCPDCQRIKGSDYPIEFDALKPDSDNYNFRYWFRIDWTNNHIIPNPERTENEQYIAKETIKWLGLNDGERPQARYDELVKYNSSSTKDIWKWSYPFFLELGRN